MNIIIELNSVLVKLSWILGKIFVDMECIVIVFICIIIVLYKKYKFIKFFDYGLFVWCWGKYNVISWIKK